MAGRRVAVEITRIYRREHRTRGSPDAAQESEYDRFASNLAASYYAEPDAREIQVRIAMPSIIASPVVRQLPREERKADLEDVATRALARLRHLPKLDAWGRHEFRVRQRDGRPATLYVLALPPESGMERQWSVMNASIGWRGYVDVPLLQSKIDAKAMDLKKYKDRAGEAVLLVVAHGTRASWFLELGDGITVNPRGFDAIYFQRYPQGTQAVPFATPT